MLGQAVAKALGDKQGIARYASVLLPMDETLTRVALDVSGRPYLVWKVAFTRSKIGEMDTELFREWFQAFAQNAGITLHIENLYGDNNHHIAETCFKGLAARCAPPSPSTRARPAACLRRRDAVAVCSASVPVSGMEATGETNFAIRIPGTSISNKSNALSSISRARRGGRRADERHQSSRMRRRAHPS